MKILLGVPAATGLTPQTDMAIHRIVKKTFMETGWWPVLHIEPNYEVAHARNRIANKARGEGYDYVFFMDDDVVPEDDALLNLLEHDVDVCLGYYVHRNRSHGEEKKTNLCKLGEHSFLNQYSRDELRQLKESGEHLIQVHGGGLGCSLIKTSVFDRVKWPWFRWYIYGTEGYGILSEDLYFDVKCEKAGIPIHADTRVHCGHMLRYVQEAF